MSSGLLNAPAHIGRMNTISPSSTSERELARQCDVKFGAQQHAAQVVDLRHAEGGTCYECGRELVVEGAERIHISASGDPIDADHAGVLESDLPTVAGTEFSQAHMDTVLEALAAEARDKEAPVAEPLTAEGLSSAANNRHQHAVPDAQRAPGRSPSYAVTAPGLKYATDGSDVTVVINDDGSIESLTRGKTTFVVPKAGKDRGHYNEVFMGDRRAQLYEPLTQRAKHMRQDIKDAVATGWLPSNLTYSVKVSSGPAIDIDVDGWNDTDRMDPQKVLWRQQDPSWRQATESA